MVVLHDDFQGGCGLKYCMLAIPYWIVSALDNFLLGNVRFWR